MDESPLHISAGGGFENLVYFLMRCGLRPSKEDCNGDTPLFWAARFGHLNIVRLLFSTNLKKDFNLNEQYLDLNRTNYVKKN